MRVHTYSSSSALGMAAEQLELDDQQYQAAQKEQESARAAKMAENDRAVDEMHEQASSIRTGAYLEGGLQIAGGAATLGGTVAGASAKDDPYDLLDASSRDPGVASRVTVASGGVASGLASPAGRLVGEANAKDHEANAASHRNRAEQDGWAADDAGQRKDRAEKRGDQMRSTAEEMLREAREARASVIAKYAGA